MPAESLPTVRTVQAVHGLSKTHADSDFHLALSAEMKAVYGDAGLLELYGRFCCGDGFVDSVMRKIIWQAVARSCGAGLKVESGAGFKHLETFEIGSGVFVGAQSFIQGRYDGTCIIGNNVWIGPQVFIDARSLSIEESVGIGPGTKILGSSHTAEPTDVPIIETDLQIKQVRIGAWADIGTNATILPGVTIGNGAIVGAGAVVAEDVAPFSVVAGVPAKFIRWRKSADQPALPQL
ncbi:acyltransferase [Rhizobium sp. Leaf262]|uniref:acyltransferase n=1 Tax=Rhizobium sp. Leaf262 TaxID=1736312 RepID=UPI0007161F96|nr:acyltransferase [Rhizobium sp. Leaf262]KQO76282.1 hexapeptide transferase [Rhizobium sp. Leaf262]